MISERDVVLVGGVRTPFSEVGTMFRDVPAVELGRVAVREALERAEIDPGALDEVVVGNVAAPADAANLARVVSLLAQVPHHVPALTVNRNCASGIEAVVEAAYRIRAGDADLVVAAAVESMSRIPFVLGDEAQRIWSDVACAGSGVGRLASLARLRPRHVRPASGLDIGLRDPVSGLSMGESAEVLAKEFGITREEQDDFALRSHRRAASAWAEGRMRDEVVPVPIPPAFERVADRDNGIRPEQTAEALASLPPVFDREYGTVTAGNSSQISDGAVALVLASRERARQLGLRIVGRVRSWGFAGCEPMRMGLGPVYAAPIALRRAGGLDMARLDLVEIHEASSAQALACFRAFASRRFFQENLGTAPVGAPDPDRVNVNGGAIAFGHPVGASGGRLVLTILREMERRDSSLGLVATCVGGGQGGALVLERS